MYAKIFAALFDGSMRGKSDIQLVFINMLARADEEGFVDKHPKSIADETGLSLKKVKSALISLQSPDPDSRTPDREGRRILLIDPENRNWGWQIVNYLKYRAIQNQSDRRETWKKASQKRRDEKKTSTIVYKRQQASTTVNTPLAKSTEVEAEAEGEEESLSLNNAGEVLPPASLKEFIAHGIVSGIGKEMVEDFYLHYDSRGWKRGNIETAMNKHEAKQRLVKWGRDNKSGKAPNKAPGTATTGRGTSFADQKASTYVAPTPGAKPKIDMWTPTRGKFRPGEKGDKEFSEDMREYRTRQGEYEEVPRYAEEAEAQAEWEKQEKERNAI